MQEPNNVHDHELAFSIKNGYFHWGFVNKQENETEKNIKIDKSLDTKVSQVNIDKHPEDIILDREFETNFVLKDINFEIKKKELVFITGPVGSGKSSLLQALLGNLQQSEHTELEVSKDVAVYFQTPWLINATIRQNIIMNCDYDEEKYMNVIELCELGSDLLLLQAGDMTELGQRGVNLSGGQKARVNLARAVYKNAPVVLLDDPMSALDAHVGQKIMKNLICSHFKNKTVILITHGTQFIHKADRIITLDEGKVIFNGTYDELKKNVDLKKSLADPSTRIDFEDCTQIKTVNEEQKMTGGIKFETFLKFVEYYKGWKIIISALFCYLIISNAFCCRLQKIV